MTIESQPRLLYARFEGEEILSEMGRLIYSILNIFSLNQYKILLHNSIDFDNQDNERPYLGLVKTLENLTLVDGIPSDTKQMTYLFDTEYRNCADKHWKSKVQVKFDIFSAYFWSKLTKQEPVMMPYPMHPRLYTSALDTQLNAGREATRAMRIFFSGDTEGYKRNRINYPSRKLTRSEIVDEIKKSASTNLVTISSSSELLELKAGAYCNKFVWANDKQFRVEPEKWLETIAMSDFFLCPPGYVMPMCHNVTEAMAVGTIPIINYPEWMTPSLTDMIDCIAFTDRKDLVKKIQYALDLTPNRIQEMRERVVEYYRNHLEPSAFLRKLDSAPGKKNVVLMITDGCVAKNAAKLGRNSILLRNR